MSESGDPATRSDVVALAARVRELEAQLIRTPLQTTMDQDSNCTNCGGSNCTNCAGDRFVNVLLPGEFERLSGAEIVRRLRSTAASGE